MSSADNSSTSFCLSSSWRTDLSIHFQPSRTTTIWMFFWITLTLSSSRFYYETDHRKCEITLGAWHCGLTLFKLVRPLLTGFEPRSLAWLTCSTGQSATTHTTVAVSGVSTRGKCWALSTRIMSDKPRIIIECYTRNAEGNLHFSSADSLLKKL